VFYRLSFRAQDRIGERRVFTGLASEPRAQDRIGERRVFTGLASEPRTVLVRGECFTGLASAEGTIKLLYFIFVLFYFHSYERVPEDLFFPYPDALLYSVYRTIAGVQYANRTNENHMKVLCHYLYHQRWVWSVQEDGPRHNSAEFVARVLGTLTK
jgi:hypothetical protein